MEETLEEFLISRGIDKNLIAKMKDEKLNCNMIGKLKEDVLKEFLPKYGDRYAVREFCNQNIYNSSTRRESLIEKLRRKISERDNKSKKFQINEQSRSSERKTKNTRMILGWICDDVQVRGKFGGGSRRIITSKNDTKKELLKKAQELFFFLMDSRQKDPYRPSTMIYWTSKGIHLMTMSVGEFFAVTQCTVLRFYLMTTKQQNANEEHNFSDGQDRQNNEVRDVEANAEPVVDVTVPVDDVSLSQFLIFNEDNSIYNVPATSIANATLLGDISNNSFYGRISPEMTEVDITKIITKTLVLHRGQIFTELMDEFAKIEKWMLPLIHINIELLHVNGKKEAAVDGGGVFKDSLTEFWNSFYDLCCGGTLNKVPLIRHDYVEKWEPIAKVVLAGYKQVKYFPVHLARPFIEYALFNESKQDLTEALLHFVGKEDSELLQKALNDVESVDKDDLLDAMEALDCKQLVQRDNIAKIMKDLAHKEFIQKPKYIIDVWHDILENKITYEELNEIYEIRKLSNKNVLKILEFPEPSTVDIDKTIGFLKKYIREADTELLQRFLRFCTSADVLTGQNITVQFVAVTGFQRVPVSHTCSDTLDLSIYDTYSELKSEFGAVLKSDIWVMDFA